MEIIIAYTGGRARGTPGPAAAAVYLTDASGTMVEEVKQHLGNAHGDFAEYYAVMLALQTIKDRYGATTIDMMIDIRLASDIVKKQLNNELEIKEPGLVPMFMEIHNMRVTSFPNLTLRDLADKDSSEVQRLLEEALPSS